MKRFILKMGIILASSAIALSAAPYAYLVNGVLSTTIESRIPFTEPKSMAEFIGNFMVQCICGLHGGLNYIGFELYQSILENVVTIAPRLIKTDLVQAVESYERKQISELELRKRIGNIVKQSNDIDE